MATPEKQLSALEQLPLEKQIEVLKKQSVAHLGDGEVFIRKTSAGVIKAVKGPVLLSESNGEIAVIQGKAMTTGKGFYRANQIAGLSIVTPEKLTLPDGRTVVNPYPITDPESGTLRKIWVKKIAIGRGPTGNLVITSATLLYDINAYFLQDLMKKVQYNAGAGRICMEFMLTEKEKQSGIFYKIDGSMGVWADVTNKDVLKAIDTFVNKKQFAERNAQTIAERLAMGKHPALSHISYVDVQGADGKRVARPTIFGYVEEDDPKTLMEIARKAECGDEVVINGQSVGMVNVTAEASAEDIIVETDVEEVASSIAEADKPNASVLGGETF